MKGFNRGVLAAVLVPIFALLCLTGYKHYVLSSGVEITLPISGYDPRDLLSGHYLIYRVDYGVENICSDALKSGPGFVCLTNKTFYYDEPPNCVTYIRGFCRGTRFEAGIEKFFIPEATASALEKDVRDRKASIVLSVTSNGLTQVKELLIDGSPWR